MSTYFSEKFKQLRKDKDLTQEQIADIFHVAPQSVSRWETGVNYPDIETLSHIALFFKVTVDELLGVDIVAKDEKAGEYLREIFRLRTAGKIDEALEVGRKAIKKYPTNIELNERLAGCLSMCDANEYKDEIIATAMRIINLTDYKSSLHTRCGLVELYSSWGMREEAKKMADTLPDNMFYTVESVADLITEGEEKRNNQKMRLHMAKEVLIDSIKRFSNDDDLSVMQKIEHYEARTQIRNLTAKIISGDVEEKGLIYPLEQLYSARESIELAELYCEIQDDNATLDHVEKAMKNSINFINYMSNNPDTFSHGWNTTRNLPWVLWEDHLMKPCFDFVRNDERFKSCLETLKSNSRELKSR